MENLPQSHGHPVPQGNVPHQVLVPSDQGGPVISEKDLQALAALGSLIVQPLAEAQKVAAIEATKQALTAQTETTKRAENFCPCLEILFGVYR